ncbi:MAG: 16S rRNA (uracil(1498)-N(3))-methyltransferase [Spartobacteria bacterium]|nr:16S rRNA (uracil(1498)-N(3))-methyltransferase [Spartobacteria bacterium]
MTIRCFAPPPQWSDATITLDQDESHHLRHVLRLDTGATVYTHDGQGRIAECEIAEPVGKQLRMRVRGQKAYPQPDPPVILVQALIKHQKMDGVVQKAVELGASEIIALETDHAVVRLMEKDYAKRIARWEGIARGALKQCGRPWMPAIRIAPSLKTLLATRKDIATWLLATLASSDSRPLQAVVPTGATAILIGPEGDFSPQEIEQALRTDAIPVSLGPYVLRAETAALFALSLLTTRQAG